MDPKRDVELSEVRRRAKGASWPSVPDGGEAKAFVACKRVQFCTAQSNAAAAEERNECGETAKKAARKVQKGIRKQAKTANFMGPCRLPKNEKNKIFICFKP